jgi:hypothetical protein
MEEGLENHINNAIIGRIEQLKSDWRAFHKQRILDYLKKHAIQFEEDPKLSFLENIMKIYKRYEYTLFRTDSEGE